MAVDAHANFAYSLVATAPSPASSGTSLIVTAADGAKFPAAPFNATVWPVGNLPTSANAEIVRVTARSTDTLTITRTQESTSARTIIVGDQIAAAITAKTLTDVETLATTIVDAQVAAGAAIATSKLALSTARSATASSFPGSPADGDEWTYIASSAGGFAWRFKYRSASASTYKWEFIGGTSWKSTSQALTTFNATAGAVTLPTITLPFSGDYSIRYGAVCKLPSGATINVQPTNNGTAISANTEDILAVGTSTVADTITITVCAESNANTGRTVGDALGLSITNAGSSSWRQGFFTVTPIRCSN